MTAREEENERIGILADGNKISQDAAELLHAEQTKVNPFTDIVEKIRQLGLVQKMKKHKTEKPKPLSVPRHEPILDRKMMGAGEIA